jgi:hypothetical protein
MALPVRGCSRLRWLGFFLFLALVLIAYEPWNETQALGKGPLDKSCPQGVMSWLPQRLQRTAPSTLELNREIGVCENQTHCICGVHRVRMLSLYPDSRRSRSLTSQAGAASCVLRPRGARVSYRCSCEGTGLCRKVGRRASTQPTGSGTGAMMSEILSQRTGYWTMPCDRRDGTALELICA